jgi:hypothetical protein
VIGIEVVGTELGEVRFPIERGKVAELARACGDELTARQRVADVAIRHGRRGGAMTLVVLETAFLAADGTLVARRRDTLIERAAP